MELPEAFDANSSHVMPSSGDQRLPHTNSFLARPNCQPPLRRSFTGCFEAQHLFISLQTASKQSVAFQRCTLNVSQSAGDPSRASNDKYQDLGAFWADVTGLYTGKTSLLAISTRCRLRHGDLQITWFASSVGRSTRTTSCSPLKKRPVLDTSKTATHLSKLQSTPPLQCRSPRCHSRIKTKLPLSIVRSSKQNPKTSSNSAPTSSTAASSPSAPNSYSVRAEATSQGG